MALMREALLRSFIISLAVALFSFFFFFFFGLSSRSQCGQSERMEVASRKSQWENLAGQVISWTD